MSTNTIDASLLAKMFLAGAGNLEANKDWINELNVFPVPDGDTGTNMTMTILSAVNDVTLLTDPGMKDLAKAIGSGSLKGARGNSGVILSQLLRGFCKVVRDYEEIDVELAVTAFQKAVETAYKAVMKPKEGTILTVARAFSEKACELYEEDPQIGMEQFLTGALEHAKETLARTPEMLPVLKEAGVVDSGGQGLVQILQGALDLYCGKEVVFQPIREERKEALYCVEYILRPKGDFGDAQQKDLRDQLTAAGSNVFTLFDEGIVKVHVETEKPGEVLTEALRCGTISSVRVLSETEGFGETIIRESDRIRARELEEMKRKAEKGGPRKPTGFICVSAGKGLSDIFMDLGVDRLIVGGQTMNPSTADIVDAVKEVNADTVFVLPNNKNIILAASQAQEMVKDKKVVVIPSKTIPQGISAILAYMPEASVAENEKLMHEAVRNVATCQVTYSVRDTHLDDKVIKEGDIMGVGDKGILSVGEEIEQTAIDAVKAMTGEESGLISIYYGEDIKEDEAQALSEKVAELYPDCEVELNFGGQPIYYYIISVE